MSEREELAVWKYRMPDPGEKAWVWMPAGARLLHVAMQSDEITAWALVNPLAPVARRTFATVGTGHPVPAETPEHVGTVLVGGFVWHVFAEPPAP